jgi:beta-lactamase class A
VGKIHISVKFVVIVLSVLVVACGILIVYQHYANIALNNKNLLNTNCNADAGMNNYQVMSTDVAWLNVYTFLVGQQRSTLNYASLKYGLSIYMQNTKGTYSLYFEDLNTGAWFGVKESDAFMPFSLLKIPVMIATLKEVELGRISLDQKIILESSDLDPKSGELWKKGVGYEISVRDLLIALVKHSDNTALLALSRHAISEQTFIEAKLASGLPPLTNDTTVSPKQYSNMLRGLYFSHYLRKPFSELALTLMMDTDFNSQLPAGLPKDIKIAHKVGIYNLEGTYHDCGIIYAKDRSYILCVMSKNTDLAEADRVISQISKIVYDYVSKNATTIVNK